MGAAGSAGPEAEAVLSLAEHLRRRQAAAYRQLSKSLAGLTEADALRGKEPSWRRYRFGVGLDGSICGIVRHVAVWKHVTAAGLERAVRWEGQSLALLDVYTHLIEHDQYHAGQVNLLRQQWGHRFPY